MTFTTAARAALGQLDTLEQMVEWTADALEQADVFFGHGTDNAADEAVVLAGHVFGFGVDVDIDTERLREPATDAERERLLEALEQRIVDRVPTPYITGEAWFAGLSFYVDARTLIPRSPVAEWIERRFSPWIDPTGVTRVLDIGTGGGCIAIATALAFPDAEVVATDISDDALAVARINVERHGLRNRVSLVRSDLFQQVDGRFDLIISNPPYVDTAELARMPAEYLHEPMGALAAGDDGLEVVHPLLREARAHLSSHGVLVVEVGASEAAFQQAYPRLPVIWLELSRGGEGVFVVEATALDALS